MQKEILKCNQEQCLARRENERARLSDYRQKKKHEKTHGKCDDKNTKKTTTKRLAECSLEGKENVISKLQLEFKETEKIKRKNVRLKKEGHNARTKTVQIQEQHLEPKLTKSTRQ